MFTFMITSFGTQVWYIYVKEFVVGSSRVGVMAMAGHVSQIN